jgi:hypothetical protein
MPASGASDQYPCAALQASAFRSKRGDIMSKGQQMKPVTPRLHFARPHVEGFKNWLCDNGYKASTVVEKVRLLAGWTDWMVGAGYALDTAMAGLAASKSAFVGKKSIRRRTSSATFKIAQSFLALQHRRLLARPGRYWVRSAPGCASIAASRTRR